MQQRSLPIVDKVIVDGRVVNIRCAGDYEAAKQRYWNAVKSLPPTRVGAQERGNHAVVGVGVVAAPVPGRFPAVLEPVHSGGQG